MLGEGVDPIYKKRFKMGRFFGRFSISTAKKRQDFQKTNTVFSISSHFACQQPKWIVKLVGLRGVILFMERNPVITS